MDHPARTAHESLMDKLVSAAVGAVIGILATAAIGMLFVGTQLHQLDSKMDAVKLDLSIRLTRVETQLHTVVQETRTP